MKVKTAIKILENHNKWRRGAEIKMEDVKVLGIAIDTVVERLKVIERAVNDKA